METYGNMLCWFSSNRCDWIDWCISFLQRFMGLNDTNVSVRAYNLLIYCSIVVQCVDLCLMRVHECMSAWVHECMSAVHKNGHNILWIYLFLPALHSNYVGHCEIVVAFPSTKVLMIVLIVITRVFRQSDTSNNWRAFRLFQASVTLLSHVV